MAKGTGCLNSWVEVAPAVLISQPKTSISPALETIKEEESEELDQDLQEF
ncbi:hypothetical protein SLEP1_g23389 [Rubroshorea leprosula]|uniref:Uncharacterized protein n=1 Tax=Rubroshorea leprosula TaxID=152421 RepID=A0AAV5JN62_9ROSI|nr:hypothetical protein SLEP1_g23389 [Rubroshorea leprosula]